MTLMMMVQINVGRVRVINAVVMRCGTVLVVPNIMSVRRSLMRMGLRVLMVGHVVRVPNRVIVVGNPMRMSVFMNMVAN